LTRFFYTVGRFTLSGCINYQLLKLQLRVGYARFVSLTKNTVPTSIEQILTSPPDSRIYNYDDLGIMTKVQ